MNTKKIYIAPSVEIVTLDSKHHLLGASQENLRTFDPAPEQSYEEITSSDEIL